MTLAELAATLTGLKPGQVAAIHHDLFADLFPPGARDEQAQATCYAFVRRHGCRIENKPLHDEVWFVKDDEAPRAA